MPEPRELSEAEFETIRRRVLAMAPDGLDEQGFQEWSERIGSGILQTELAKAERAPAGDPVRRYMSGLVGSGIDTVKGVGQMVVDHMFPSPEGVIRNLNIGGAILDGSAEQAGKARAAFDRGEYVEAAARAAGSVPLIGTPAAQIADDIEETGDVAGGMGRATFLVGAPFAGRAAAPYVGRGLQATGRGVSAAASKVGAVGAPLRRFAARRAANMVGLPSEAVDAASALLTPKTPSPVTTPVHRAPAPAPTKAPVTPDAAKAPTPAAAPAPAASQSSAQPAAAPPARPADARTTAASSPTGPAPSVRALQGDTLHLAPVDRTPGQMSPQAIQNDLGLSARRLKVTLSAEQFDAAADLVKQGGRSPVQAVAEVAKAPAAPTSSGPAAPKTAAARVTRDEATEYARLMTQGKTAEEATAAIQAMRKFQKVPGTQTPHQMRSRIRKRVATGKWPEP